MPQTIIWQSEPKADLDRPLMPKKKATFPAKARKRQRLAAVFAVIAVCLFTSLPRTAHAEDFAISIYGGRMTDSDLAHALSPNADFVDAYLMVGAFAWTFKRFFDDGLALEVEGNVVKYFGDQDNWEFNAAVAGRWLKFPWNDTVATTIAWGIGPSYASEVPEVETEIHETSAKLLVFWFAEITLGPPKSRWAALFRLHHRSTAFGTFADDGGSNSLALGLKFRF